MWKAENVRNELGDLTKEIFSQSVEGATWFLPVPYNKMQEETDKLNKERARTS
jgi:hypothetical protein